MYAKAINAGYEEEPYDEYEPAEMAVEEEPENVQPVEVYEEEAQAGYEEAPEEEVYEEPAYEEPERRVYEERKARPRPQAAPAAQKPVRKKAPQRLAAEAKPKRRSPGSVRNLTPEERSLFGTFIQDQKSKAQIVNALEKLSMASYTGNILLTGEIEKDNDTFAKNIMKYLSRFDGNFSGSLARISAEKFNEKNPLAVVDKLSSGELYITNASKLLPQTVTRLHKALNRAECAIVVVLADKRKGIEKLLAANPILTETFNARIDLQHLNDKELAKFAKVYAKEREYSIDSMGMLALLTKIEDNQRNDHAVSVGEVREMVDNAIRHATSISPVHFFEIVTQRRYDDEDRIILKERDFIA